MLIPFATGRPYCSTARLLLYDDDIRRRYDSTIPNHTALHYTTLHHTTLHCTALLLQPLSHPITLSIYLFTTPFHHSTIPPLHQLHHSLLYIHQNDKSPPILLTPTHHPAACGSRCRISHRSDTGRPSLPEVRMVCLSLPTLPAAHMVTLTVALTVTPRGISMSP